mmetsp:Transcript_54688/g.158850  ORF Transcript_54688/g.158850 Transcript_54688/m.158850 type:complete len:282 (+) Transcript_54688:727-1572(+)
MRIEAHTPKGRRALANIVLGLPAHPRFAAPSRSEEKCERREVLRRVLPARHREAVARFDRLDASASRLASCQHHIEQLRRCLLREARQALRAVDDGVAPEAGGPHLQRRRRRRHQAQERWRIRTAGDVQLKPREAVGGDGVTEDEGAAVPGVGQRNHLMLEVGQQLLGEAAIRACADSWRGPRRQAENAADGALQQVRRGLDVAAEGDVAARLAEHGLPHDRRSRAALQGEYPAPFAPRAVRLREGGASVCADHPGGVRLVRAELYVLKGAATVAARFLAR